MAYYVKRGQMWQFRIYVTDQTGERKRVSRSGFKTKKAAQLAAAKTEADYHSGLNTDFTDKTLAVYFEEWYEVNIKPQVRPATKRQYTAAINTIKKDAIGGYQLVRITPKIYQKFINRIGKNHAMWTVKKISSEIRACAKQAVFNNDLPRDFTQKVKLVYNNERTRKAV